MTAAKHTSREFLTFLTGLVERAERAQEIHVVLDNLSGLHRFENLLNRRYRIDEFASSLVTIPGSNRGHPSASRGHHLLSTVFRSPLFLGGAEVQMWCGHRLLRHPHHRLITAVYATALCFGSETWFLADGLARNFTSAPFTSSA